MDDAPLPSDGSVTPTNPPRKQRLGRGLKHMLGQSAPKADADVQAKTASENAPESQTDLKGKTGDTGKTASDHAGNVRLVHEPATPPAVTSQSKQSKMSPATNANVVEDAVSLFTTYDERFTALSGQLEAACNLLADQRQLEVRRARRSAYLGWSLVAALIVIGMVGLWRAGETIGGQRNEIRQMTTQASILSGQMNASELRINDMQSQLQSAAMDQSQLKSELTDMRNALSKANLVIDQWMQRAHDAQDSQSAETKKSSAKAE